MKEQSECYEDHRQAFQTFRIADYEFVLHCYPPPEEPPWFTGVAGVMVEVLSNDTYWDESGCFSVAGHDEAGIVRLLGGLRFAVSIMLFLLG